MLLHSRPELIEPLTIDGNGRNDLRPPATFLSGMTRKVEHVFKVSAGVVGSGAVGLVDDEDVSDFHQSGLVGLNRIAPTWVHDHNGGVSGTRYLYFDLANTNGLHHYPLAPSSFQQTDSLRRGQSEAAEMTAGRHRSDEHSLVQRMFLHSDPIAQDGTARERRRRIDGQDPDRQLVGSHPGHEGRGQRGFSCTGSAGYANGVAATGIGEGQCTGGSRSFRSSFDLGEESGQRWSMTTAGRFIQRGDVRSRRCSHSERRCSSCRQRETVVLSLTPRSSLPTGGFLSACDPYPQYRSTLALVNPAVVTLVAHQGGWDEILLVALPLLVIAGLLVLANRRAVAKLDEAKANGAESDDS